MVEALRVYDGATMPRKLDQVSCPLRLVRVSESTQVRV
jgi:hypothetical protein